MGRETERERGGGVRGGGCWRLLGNIRDIGSEVRDKRRRERREGKARGGGGKAMTERENEKAKGDGKKVKHTHIFFNQYGGNVAPW